MKVKLNKNWLIKICFVAFFTIVSGYGYAQNAIILSGLVTDAKLLPLPGVNIVVKNLSDSVSIKTTSTDKNGRYSINLPKPGDYTLTLSFVGYEKQVVKAKGIDRERHLQAIILTALPTTLKEVTVVSKKQAVEVQAGKLVYNIDKSITAAGKSAYELLQRTPGIATDQDENLTLKGSPKVNVMMDGKMTYLSARQLSTLLKSMPASDIKSIEVITTPSAQYDASGNNGIININTKKSNKAGYGVEFTSGLVAGQYLSNMQSMAGNLKTGRVNVFGNYSYNYDHSAFHRSSLRLADNNGIVTIYDRRSEDPSIAFYHSYKAGADIDISKNQQVGVIYNGNNDNWSRDAGGPTFLRNAAGEVIGVIQNRNITKEPTRNNAYHLNYIAKLDTAGSKLSADADYAMYRNNSYGTQDNRLFDAGSNARQPLQSLRISQPGNIDIRSLKTDLVLPAGKFKLLGGLKYASVKTDNNFAYDSLINNSYQFSPYLSNHFIYTEKVSAAYLSVGRKWNKVNLNAGLRMEHTESNGYLTSFLVNSDNKRIYTNLFPSLSADYSFNADNKIGASVSRRINRPAYAELNPSRFYFDKFSYYQGNPSLRPEFSWVASVNYTLLDKYIATFSYTRTSGLIAEQSVQDVSTGIMVLTNTNFAHSDLYDLMVSVPVSIGEFWEMSNTVDIYYQAYPSRIGNITYNLRRSTADLSTLQTFKLSAGINLEARARYISPALSGTYLLRYYFSADAGAKRSFFNKKLDANVSVSDIFQTIHFWADNVANLQASYNHTRDTRRLAISLVYHFGGQFVIKKINKLQEQERL